MNTKRDDGGPAFPVPPDQAYATGMSLRDGTAVCAAATGMSLRDLFAAAALQGILAQPLESDWAFSPGLCAGSAYEYADAMIQARKEGA
jgi:hypothetical protein